MEKDNYIILTGAMGAGKSTVISRLKEMGYSCINEPAREILAEQRQINGNGVPEKDPKLFTELMLSRMIFQYQLFSEKTGPVFFDRGIPDITGYADIFNIEKTVFENASDKFRFNKNVFMFSGYKEIYVNDEERKMSFELADKFGRDIGKIYQDSGYNIHEVPLDKTDKRADLILEILKSENNLF
ncbi:MAG: AAA family ATPase [Bacteroidetes bacterium]|nr:AAA family ATPase [Bacteroidota bacterium]